MHEILFGAVGSALVLAFAVTLELRVEGAIDVTWMMPFAFLWMALLVYSTWVYRSYHDRPRHWTIAAIVVGLVLGVQSLGVPIVLERSECAADTDGCNDRRRMLARIIIAPLALIDLVVLVYLIWNYVWTKRREKEETDKYVQGLIASKSEWGVEDPLDDLPDEDVIDAAMADLERRTQMARDDDDTDAFIYDT
jgi:cytochrome bd-type quinol oxidase subunit 2